MGINTSSTMVDYRRKIETLLNDYLGMSPWHANHIVMFANSNKSFSERPEYVALIAALDMFFHRFPKHEFAGGRIGTITSRNRSAAALNSLIYIRDFTSHKVFRMGHYFHISRTSSWWVRLKGWGKMKINIFPTHIRTISRRWVYVKHLHIHPSPILLVKHCFIS